MNIHALLLLCSLSTAIAIPFDPDYQFEDPNPATEAPASDPLYEAQVPIPIPFDQLNPGVSPLSPADSQPQESDTNNPPPVADSLPESRVGDDVCCEPKRGGQRQVCNKRK